MIITLYYGALVFAGVTNVQYNETLDWTTAQGTHWHCIEPVVVNYNGFGQIIVGGECAPELIFASGFETT